MKLKARPDLHFAPVPGGVYFSGVRGSFVLRGSDVLHAVAQGCVPLLEQGATEDELVAAIGTERARPAVRHLVGKLRDSGMLLDTAALTAPEPPTAVRERHPEPLARLESLHDDPYAAFQRLRTARVTVAGPPEATGPAARGLRRAGVADVTVTGSLDARRGTYDAMDAVLDATGGQVPELPEHVPYFPLLLGGRVTLVGPALTGAGRARTWAAFRDRALAWADAEDVTPAPRPVADALAGALAGQLIFDTLTGTAAMGEAHVVHGADLVSDRVTVEGAHVAAATGRPSSLQDAVAQPMPEGETALEAAGAVARRWTGLIASAAGEDLPQMPLALRAAEQRGGRPGTVVAWAAHQETATVAAALAALRAESPKADGVPAAGLTEEHWLLDGALRTLTPDARPLGEATDDDVDAEAHRIREHLRPLLASGPAVGLLHVPGLDWRLAKVTDGTGVLGQAWGATATEAVRNAWCTALARTLTTSGSTTSGSTASEAMSAGRTPTPGTPAGRTTADAAASGCIGPVDEVSTDALLFADSTVLGTLRKQLTEHAAETGRGWAGHPARVDAVLGEIPLWYGPVVAEERPRETHDGN
ncbi:hypothetical protein ACH46N_14355 [Streptomyces pristinaespiralis]|uniref:Putative peptidase containing docking domain protein n=1 Tax=Streptomyces pristinaespiralis TaxID=38300 RepID=A0A0M4D9B3_STRPR|nr:hypothetical protein [Streptomyces pristinaespiralis]ALC20226.1 putative peptidase containing docking domain protein [Streptomyces pristinaespiralis]QMU16893.1 hypothetical protein H3L99_27410 [Streptomyces pristinaespiralis]